MLNNGLRRWTNRINSYRRGTAIRKRMRRRPFSLTIPAEILETRALLSATHLAFVPTPASPQTAGTSFTVTVQVQNNSNSVVTSDHSIVTLTEKGPGTFSNGKTSVTQSAVAGVATFSVTLDTSGTYTLTAKQGTLTNAVDSGLVVNANTAGPEHLAFIHVPSTGTAGTPLKTFDVVVEDQFGNIDTTADHNGDNVVLTESGPGGFDTSSQINAHITNGVAIFNSVILDQAGAYKLTAGDADNLSIPGATSKTVTISAGAPAQLSFEQGTTSGSAVTGTAGVAFTAANGLKVDVLDAFGNLVTTDTSVVTLTVVKHPSPSYTTYVAPTHLSATAVNGVATFHTTFFTATQVFNGTSFVTRTYLLKATDAADGLTTSDNANSGFVKINAAAATQLQFIVQPGAATSGANVPTFDVAVEDAYGNVVTNSNALVTVTVNSGSGNQTPTSNGQVGATNGIAAFSGFQVNNFASPTPGSFTLEAASTGLTSAFSDQFTVT